MQRRNFLKNSALASLGLTALPFVSKSQTNSPLASKIKDSFTPLAPQITTPRGAIYIPAKAYNTWQQWKEYNQDITLRDFGYAKSIGLNSLRIWLSYEYWLENPKRHEQCLEMMLQAADKSGFKILLALFDSCGVDNTAEARKNKDPKTAVAVMSPGLAISRDPKRWQEPTAFVNRIMDLHGTDNRLLAIEVMNEPGLANGRLSMTRHLFKAAKEKQKSIPLSVGSLPGMENWGHFMDLGIDILQFHNNYPTALPAFKRDLAMAKEVAQVLGRPLWITEWQRLRPAGNGWNQHALPKEQLYPNFKSLASHVRDAAIGNYFWSLMVKPAYLTPQRNIGTINGLFYEDGSVFSLADARSISNNPGFNAKEKGQM
ncbi:hypothetical protein SAMN05192529_10746 [Arachidicoccus rhizosphaerae]|jgi:hypothetical protein|uniref:Cellulase (Glycosyl hydrolase family 5) n=1 Tax=Arachidicoccus rhizosphaerae TaxID=551991 RepID=A0A1H3Y1D7_9BACT|nr:hypothetical protein [Arachidicoccus rhizosphaerae]SEA05393.1 hypothetical protein SAMN05192529_10746 [Arachidicoccus rhizosphaerae]